MFRDTVYMFGDQNQGEPVEAGSQIHYRYPNSKTIEQMCPQRETLQYIEGCSRCDKKKMIC